MPETTERTEQQPLHYQDNELRTNDDGEILCPDEACDGTVRENDVAVRSNSLVVRDGQVIAYVGDGDWQTDENEPYTCDGCGRAVEMPPTFRIENWF